MTRLGIECTGDPFWVDSLSPAQLQAVYGMLWAEDIEARETVERVRPKKRKPAPRAPEGASAGAWATLMSMRADR